ncbi:mCG1049168, isoform CRA_b, partial [Mus musculus]
AVALQIYIYLHVINIEAEPELVWATIPGQFSWLCFHPVRWPPGLRMPPDMAGETSRCQGKPDSSREMRNIGQTRVFHLL